MTLGRILRVGVNGDDVRAVQALLNEYFGRSKHGITEHEIARAAAGFPRVVDVVTSGFQILEDGDYGRLTEAAVRLVQVNEDGLGLDGQVGPMTYARLQQRSVEPVEAEDPANNGLIIGGKIYPVPGHKVIGPHDAAWAHLAPGDSRPRLRKPDGSLVYWVRQWIVHKTIADDPEILLEEIGPAGMARRTAEYWQRRKADGSQEQYGGAQLVFGDDGEIACLADLLLVEAYHATRSNPWSVGSEMREVGPRAGQKGGKFYRPVLDANTRTLMIACPALGIQMQTHVGPYRNKPLTRMDDDGRTPGGPDVVGIFGHRENTDQRGMWDAGELWKSELKREVPGFEFFDFEKGEDLVAWKDRQSDLVRAGHKLQITGVADPATTAALKLEGYRDGIWALGKAA